MRTANALLAMALLTGASNPPIPSGGIGAKPEQPSASQPAQDRTTETRGTEQYPLFVKSIPSPESEADASHKEYEHHEKPSLERRLTAGTEMLAGFTFLLMLFTGGMWIATYRLSNDAKQSSSTQEARMRDSIAEAGRATAAMENIAKATVDNAALMQGVMHRQMRAYISTELAGANYQDANLRFQVDITLTNNGFTPARKVSYSIDADVFGDALPVDFAFPSYGDIRANDATLAPRQAFVIHGVVRNRLPDDDAQVVMRGDEKRLFCWGTIYYEDIFESKWRTDFCQSVTFTRYTDDGGKERVRTLSMLHEKHNSST